MEKAKEKKIHIGNLDFSSLIFANPVKLKQTKQLLPKKNY